MSYILSNGGYTQGQERIPKMLPVYLSAPYLLMLPIYYFIKYTPNAPYLLPFKYFPAGEREATQKKGCFGLCNVASL